MNKIFFLYIFFVFLLSSCYQLSNQNNPSYLTNKGNEPSNPLKDTLEESYSSLEEGFKTDFTPDPLGFLEVCSKELKAFALTSTQESFLREDQEMELLNFLMEKFREISTKAKIYSIKVENLSYSIKNNLKTILSDLFGELTFKQICDASSSREYSLMGAKASISEGDDKERYVATVYLSKAPLKSFIVSDNSDNEKFLPSITTEAYNHFFRIDNKNQLGTTTRERLEMIRLGYKNVDIRERLRRLNLEKYISPNCQIGMRGVFCLSDLNEGSLDLLRAFFLLPSSLLPPTQSFGLDKQLDDEESERNTQESINSKIISDLVQSLRDLQLSGKEKSGSSSRNKIDKKYQELISYLEKTAKKSSSNKASFQRVLLRFSAYRKIFAREKSYHSSYNKKLQELIIGQIISSEMEPLDRTE